MIAYSPCFNTREDVHVHRKASTFTLPKYREFVTINIHEYTVYVYIDARFVSHILDDAVETVVVTCIFLLVLETREQERFQNKLSPLERA